MLKIKIGYDIYLPVCGGLGKPAYEERFLFFSPAGLTASAATFAAAAISEPSTIIRTVNHQRRAINKL
jgi:hypothetical protein